MNIQTDRDTGRARRLVLKNRRHNSRGGVPLRRACVKIAVARYTGGEVEGRGRERGADDCRARLIRMRLNRRSNLRFNQRRD